MKKLYSFSRDDARRMILEQGGVCDLCKNPIDPESWDDTVIDRDHQTGRKRGMLHKNCSLGVEAFGDSIARIRQAEQYLQKHALKELSELGQDQEAAIKEREERAGEKLVFCDGKWVWKP